MKSRRVHRIRRALKDDRGQTMIFVALGMVAFLGFAGIAIDTGHSYYAYQQLVSSTNAAVLAGAAALPNTDLATSNVTLYSSTAAMKNATTSLINAQSTSTFACFASVTNLNIPCLISTGSTSGVYNAMRVTQTAQVPLWFGGMFGVPKINISATATAAMRGLSAPYNVAIILDASLSQNSSDDNCGLTEIACELQGVQTLLQELYPCKATDVTCSISNGVAANSVDRVALFTFPNVTAATASIDSSCTITPVTSTFVNANGGQANPGWNNSATYGGYFDMYGAGGAFRPWPNWPTAIAYTFPSKTATSYSPGAGATYEVTLGLGSGDANGFFSDYRTSNMFSTQPALRQLNTSSLLVRAAGGKSGCGGIATPNYDGNIGTYYAGVIYAAQAALTAEQAANPGSDNALIILSDGNATAQRASGSYPGMGASASGTGTYPSYNDECAQSVIAAQYATSQGTTVYSVAYGSETSGCTADTPAMTPCQTMQLMASGATAGNQSQYFYSDYLQTGTGINTNCKSTQNPNNTSVAGIFANIGTTFGRARLIPNTSQ